MPKLEEYQDYKVIAAKGSNKLSELVNEEMDAGYIPFESHQVSTTYIGDNEDGTPKLFTLFSQALVLPFPDDLEDGDEEFKDQGYPEVKS